jgi:hypothetical protein
MCSTVPPGDSVMPAAAGYLPRGKPGTAQLRGSQDASSESRSIIKKSANGTGATS